MLLHLGHHLQAQVGAAVQHRQQHALDVQAGVQRLFHPLDGLHQAGHTLQRVILALDGDHHAIRGSEGIDRQQGQTGRTVDQDEVEVLRHGGDGGFQAELTPVHPHQLQLSARQADVAAGNGKVAEIRLFHHVLHLHAAHQHLIDALFLHRHAQAGGGVALGIQVDNQHPLAHIRHEGRQVDRRGGFAHAALLIDDCNGLCHGVITALRYYFDMRNTACTMHALYIIAFLAANVKGERRLRQEIRTPK